MSINTKMLIYQFTHLPTGKIYIGSKKNESAYYNGYNSSSKIVSSMIAACPTEWERQVLLTVEADDSWDFARVVEYEQRLIKRMADELGWDRLWNQHYTLRCGSRLWSPESQNKQRASMNKTEVRKKIKDKALEQFSDPAAREQRKQNQKELWQDKQYRQMMSVARVKRYSTPELCGNYKGNTYVGTNKVTGETVTFIGTHGMAEQGFEYRNVLSCVKGKRKSHKGYTWTCIKKEST